MRQCRVQPCLLKRGVTSEACPSAVKQRLEAFRLMLFRRRQCQRYPGMQLEVLQSAQPLRSGSAEGRLIVLHDDLRGRQTIRALEEEASDLWDKR